MRLLLDDLEFKFSLSLEDLSHLALCALQCLDTSVQGVDLSRLKLELLVFEFEVSGLTLGSVGFLSQL